MDIKRKDEVGIFDNEKELKKVNKVHSYLISGYSLVALVLVILYFLFHLNVIPVGEQKTLALKLTASAFIIMAILMLGKFLERIILRSHRSKSFKYNFTGIIRLVMAILVGLVIISFLFRNWYAAAVSLGVFSLVLGFALQVPISSFIGWLYIIFRAPYRVGDRIEINNTFGDVVEIGYLDTTIWEFGGRYLSSDLPTGRLIRFPNTLVLQSAVFNYSWSRLSYMWNETAVQVAYDSDLDFVKKTMLEATQSQLDPQIPAKIAQFKNLIRETPVDIGRINENPIVNIRVNERSWVEVFVTYLVDPRKTSAVRTRILDEVLKKLNANPDKVRFPEGVRR